MKTEYRDVGIIELGVGCLPRLGQARARLHQKPKPQVSSVTSCGEPNWSVSRRTRAGPNLDKAAASVDLVEGRGRGEGGDDEEEQEGGSCGDP
jgi:hypothetical protein